MNWIDLIKWEWICFIILNSLAGIGFVLNLKRTLQLITPVNSKSLKPNAVWWLIIPGINLITQFIIIPKVAHSLYLEFSKNRWNTKPIVVSYHIGMLMCVCSILMLLPISSIFFWFCFTVLFFVFWIGIYYVRLYLQDQVSTSR